MVLNAAEHVIGEMKLMMNTSNMSLLPCVEKTLLQIAFDKQLGTVASPPYLSNPSAGHPRPFRHPKDLVNIHILLTDIF